MRIGPVDTDNTVFIIAEIGNNHEGSPERAMEMIVSAAEAGVDAVKFQTIIPERLVEPDQKERLAQLRKLCLPPEAFPVLKKAADAARVQFLSTPFDLESVTLLNDLVPAFKIASADNDFYPLIDAVADTGKPVLMSTGLSDLEEITAARDYLLNAWADRNHDGQLALLHCVSSYPTPACEANLLAVRTLADLGTTVGYSDHTLGIDAAVLSVALGARIVEKHFTLDKAFSDFRDHQLSADPQEMRALVERIRQTETLLGNGCKKAMPSEAATVAAARRSAVTIEDLDKGTRLNPSHVAWLRPGGGVPPSRASDLIGRCLNRAVCGGRRIEMAMLD